MPKETKTSIARALFENELPKIKQGRFAHLYNERTQKETVKKINDQVENETKHMTSFLMALYLEIKRKKSPETHHIFCDEIAGKMTKEGQISKDDVQKLVTLFTQHPYHYTETNGSKKFAGFRVTTMFITWLKKNGAL